MAKIQILQLNYSSELHYHRFCPWKWLEKYNLKFDMNNYHKVYEYESDDTDLDNIYVKFQGVKPEGYTGVSVSISDLIKINEDTYYVDDWGFKKI